MQNVIEAMNIVDIVRSEKDMAAIEDAFKRIEEFVPGPITVQKLIEIDQRVVDGDAIDLYSATLIAVSQKTLQLWPHFKDSIVKLYLFEDNFDVSKEIMSVLCGLLKTEVNLKIVEMYVDILYLYVRSDCVLIAIVNCCNLEINNDMDKYKLQSEWENYVQELATLPERVANKLERNTPVECNRENHCFSLVFQIIRAIDFIVDSSYYQNAKYDLSYLSYFISKIIIHYGSTEPLNHFVDLIIHWANDAQDPAIYVKRKLIQTILYHLNRQAIDNLSVIVLKKCPLLYDNSEQTIKRVLGDNIDKSKDWRLVLTYKIPSISNYDYKNTVVVENLVYYLSNSAEILSEFVIRLANIWADSTSINPNNLNQHIYVAQLLILSVKYLTILMKASQRTWQTCELKNILFNGVPKHLNSLSSEIRCIGMATVEIVLNNIKLTEDKANDAELKFEYTDMNEHCQQIYQCLVEVNSKCLLDPDFKAPADYKKVTEVKVQDLLNYIAEKTSNKTKVTTINTVLNQTIKNTVQKITIIKAIEAKADISFDESDLDSDDDLQPYDMGNDLPQSAKKRPAYIRDLIEKINEAKDYEDFEACLAVSEELVSQLEDDDSKLAIEFLQLFLHLDCKFNVDDFEDIRFNTCVAIVCVQPMAAAEYICSEFHADVGRYSISAKILMLDVLSEAANRIADVRSDRSDKSKNLDVKIIETEDLPPDEIIRRRLINKTKYFHSKRSHPFAKAKKNLFASVSDYFFYPLVFGFGKRQLNLSYHNLKHDSDNILLLKYLSVVGNIILASKNCPNCPKYCSELMEILMYLRFNAEVKIQMCVMSIIASIVLALPPSILKSDFFESMMDIRAWLMEWLSKMDLSLRTTGEKSDAAVFAGQVLYLVEKALAEN